MSRTRSSRAIESPSTLAASVLTVLRACSNMRTNASKYLASSWLTSWQESSRPLAVENHQFAHSTSASPSAFLYSAIASLAFDTEVSCCRIKSGQSQRSMVSCRAPKRSRPNRIVRGEMPGRLCVRRRDLEPSPTRLRDQKPRAFAFTSPTPVLTWIAVSPYASSILPIALRTVASNGDLP